MVAEMVKWLAGERSRLSGELLAQSKSRFGSPVAQRRLADRMRKAGGKALLDLRLRPGKRGNLTIYFLLRVQGRRFLSEGRRLRDSERPSRPTRRVARRAAKLPLFR
jgi:hypothetical protein